MLLKNRIKISFKSEMQKIEKMQGKDKVWYIWEYYKFHILVIALVLFLSISIGTTIYNNRFDNILSCLIINGNLEDKGFDNMEQEIQTYLNLNPDTETLYLDSSMYIDIDQPTEYSYSCLAKISALTASKDLDVMVSDQRIIDHFGNLGAFVDLKEYLPEDLKVALEDYFYYGIDNEGNTKAYGLKMEESYLVKNSGLQLDTPRLSVLEVSLRPERTIAFIRYAFGL